MTQYNVTGMSCAACSARVEKAVSKVPGVKEVSVNLLTNSMGVTGTAAPDEIIKAVEAAGYGASIKDNAAISTGIGAETSQNGSGTQRDNQNSNKKAQKNDPFEDTETPKLKKRLISSIVFLVALMYLSMGHMMWGWPLPPFLEGNHVAVGITEMLLAIIVMVINKKFFINGFKSIIHLSPNMDALVAIGSGAAFGYSLYTLYAMTGAQAAGDTAEVMRLMNEFYFESAAMILALITVGKTLEAYSKGRTTDALKSLVQLRPNTANVLRDGKEVTIDAENMRIGDIFVVRPGESVPGDGVVVKGRSAVNESALTGESIPQDKDIGDEVYTGTVNQSGYMECKVTKTGGDTALANIIKTVEEASATKAPIAKAADKVSAVFVPVVMGIALVTFVIWMIVSKDIGFSIARAISVLVISCPCALGLATPVAIMVGSGVGARNGILFKNASSLEAAGKIKVVALDKTGTITSGEPIVTDVVPAGEDKTELLLTAASLESKSEHPLAKAVTRYAAENNIISREISEFEAVSGNGLRGKTADSMEELIGGNLAFVKNNAEMSEELIKTAEKLAENGKTPMFFAKNGKILGIIAVADTVKHDSADAIARLRQMNIKTVMITGDNERTAKAIGAEVGVDEVISGVLPGEKAATIKALRKYGNVAMVGDGINDAPALTEADLGVAIGTGTDIAIDSANVVLMKNSLREVPAALVLGRKTLLNIRENLFWAFIYNVLAIPLAAGAYIALFGWSLNPMVGAAAMSLSSFCVVTNALRLNLIKLYPTENCDKIKKERPNKAVKEEYPMTKTVKVEGMMCHHCEAHVKKAIEAIPGVTMATADHEKGEVSIELAAEVSDDAIKAAIIDAGYEYKG